ncbi:MAG TPA: hypothetical protein VIS96_03460 [Terrimicrobiaceae bacterium]
MPVTNAQFNIQVLTHVSVPRSQCLTAQLGFLDSRSNFFVGIFWYAAESARVSHLRDGSKKVLRNRTAMASASRGLPWREVQPARNGGETVRAWMSTSPLSKVYEQRCSLKQARNEVSETMAERISETIPSVLLLKEADGHAIGEEAEWWSDDRGNVLGIVIDDLIDDDWSWVVLGRDDKALFRAIDLGVSLQTQDAASREVQAKINEHAADGSTEFPQGDTDGKKNQILIPAVAKEKLHRNFRILTEKEHHSPARELIRETLNLLPLDVFGGCAQRFYEDGRHLYSLLRTTCTPRIHRLSCRTPTIRPSSPERLATSETSGQKSCLASYSGIDF